MNADLLLAHYDRIADAPDAIARLRRFVLDLAVRGKLMPQDPADEPASELLKRIATERKSQGKLGKIKNATYVQSLAELATPYSLPSGWVWERFANIASIESNLVDPRHYKTYPHIAPDNIESGTGRLLPFETIGNSGVFSSKHLFYPGCLLYSKIRPALAKVTSVDFEGLCSADMYPIRPFVNREYLLDFMLAEVFVRQSVSEDNRVAMPKINQEALSKILVAIPPLAEQHRIVAKVDELMALCDQLEAARADREATRDRLAAASLARLNTPDPETFEDDARFALDALPALTIRPDQIKQLRQTILNLAVRGKLVPQDPSDEPASALLKRIAAEKGQLAFDGEIRKMSTLCGKDWTVFPSEVMSGWQATTIEQILVELQTGPFGSSLHQSDYVDGGVPVINPASIQNERIVPINKMAVGSSTLQRLSSFKLREGDIVMGRRGEMGRCAVVTQREAGWLCGTGSLILRLPKNVYSRFFVLLIGSPYVRGYLSGSAVGATMQNLNQRILLNLPIGLPPLAEQHRIVAKVDELMGLCDRLEASLGDAAAIRRRLLDALLTEALSPEKAPPAPQ